MCPDDLDEEMAVYDDMYEDIWKEDFKPFPEHLVESDEEDSSVDEFSYWF